MGFDRRQLINDLETALRLAMDGRQSVMWTALPCIVKSVDLTKMTIEAQPAIQGTVENEAGDKISVNLPLLVDVPIVFPSAGGFTLTFPIAAGDEVLVVFGSRCIDSWWQSGGIQKPAEMRMHDLSDGFAIPGPRSQPRKISNISSTTVQLRNDAGSSFIEIGADGKVNITATSVNITGNLSVSGTVTGGTASTPHSLTTHTHSGVTSGGSNTGGPVG